MATALLGVPAPAKLNLFLHVVGRREDGYHLLQTVFTFVDLCDYLDFTLREDGKILRDGDSLDGLAAEDDLIIKAAKRLQQFTGTQLGVSIRCQKNIPAGAGMGGGSSDAATTLMALNKLWQTRLSRQQLMDLGLTLGADVPIFIYGQSAFAQGIGEQFTAVTLPQMHYLLLKSAESVATPVIFSEKGLTRNQKPIIITDFTDYKVCPDSDWNDSILLFGENNLESVACKYAASIQQNLNALRNQKLHARMTGSGSALFVAFLNKEQATRQKSQICGTILHSQPELQNNTQCWVVSGLNIHPLYNWLNEFGD